MCKNCECGGNCGDDCKCKKPRKLPKGSSGCTCPAKDSQVCCCPPPDEGKDNIDPRCPQHNDRPEPDPKCPLHGHLPVYPRGKRKPKKK